MLKILLVYDDFQELTSVELMLKKIGFDVVGITSEFSLSEQLLSFNPQIVVAQGRTAKVSTANVGRRLRESSRWDGQSVLIFYPNAKPQPTELLRIRMDVGLEFPVDPTKMVQVLAQLGSLDANQLLDKLIKNMAESATAFTNKENVTGSGRSSSSADSVFVSGGNQAAEANQKIGGAANTEVRKALNGTSLEDESRTTVSAGADILANSEKVLTAAEAMEQLARGFYSQSETEKSRDLKSKAGVANEPLFPLNTKQSAELDRGKVAGATPNSKSTPDSLKNSFDINPFQLDNMTQDPVMQELESLLNQKKPDLSINPPLKDPSRLKKYEEYMKTIPVQQLASIKRRDAKSRLRDLVKDMDKQGLEGQDVLRREYVKALFKKQG